MDKETSTCRYAGRGWQGEGKEIFLSPVVLAGRENGGEAWRGLGGEAGMTGLAAQVVTALTTQAGQVPEWVRLLPLGDVPLGDGREPLWVDQEALAAMVAHFQERGLDLVVDYEHQTLSGHKAPAAGWIKELEIRIAGETPAPQDGLWARLEWTATARDHLAAREYRYFSPVLRLEDKTRRPLALLHAALTNTPAINGLAPLVAKSGGQGERQIPQIPQIPPNPPLKKGGTCGMGIDDISPDPFLDKGGSYGMVIDDIPPNPPLEKGGTYGTGRDVIPPNALEKGGNYGLAGQQIESLKHLQDLAVLLGLPEHAGASRVRGAVLALKGNLEHLQGAQEELAALKEELAARTVQEEVAAAIASGKVQPCQKDSALRYARLDLEGFRSYVENALPQAPLGRLNLSSNPREERGAGEGLTPQQILICQKLGLSPEAFKAQETYLKQENLL